MPIATKVASSLTQRPNPTAPISPTLVEVFGLPSLPPLVSRESHCLLTVSELSAHDTLNGFQDMVLLGEYSTDLRWSLYSAADRLIALFGPYVVAREC